MRSFLCLGIFSSICPCDIMAATAEVSSPSSCTHRGRNSQSLKTIARSWGQITSRVNVYCMFENLLRVRFHTGLRALRALYIFWASQPHRSQILLPSFPFSSERNEDSESVNDSPSVTHLLHSSTGIWEQFCSATKPPYSDLLCCNNGLQKHLCFSASIVAMPGTAFISCFPNAFPDSIFKAQF